MADRGRKTIPQLMWEDVKFALGLGALLAFCSGVVLFAYWLVEQL